MTAEQLLFLLTFTAAATVAQIAATFITDRIKKNHVGSLKDDIGVARDEAAEAHESARFAHKRLNDQTHLKVPAAPRGRPRKVEPATVPESALIPFETASDRDHGDEHRAREFAQAAGRG